MPLTPQQRSAVESAHEPLFIEAGAGTGKTFTLTKRIAHGLSESSGPLIGAVKRLLTITYTNKAAGELIGRVRAELRARHLDEESLQIDAAWISTIHAMCRRILHTHAFEAGVDPGADLLTEDETAALSALALDQLLKSRANDARLIALLDAFGADEAVNLITRLSSLFELAPGGAADFDLGPRPGNAQNGLRMLHAVLETLRTARADAEAAGVPAGKKTYEKNLESIASSIELLGAWLRDAPDQVDWAQIDDILEECELVRGGSFKEPFKELFARCKDALLEAKVQARCARAYQHLEMASALAEEQLELHRALKRERGALDTNDLLIATYRLLEQHPEIAREYRDQFDSLMVDEFQDTDSLQVGIIRHLCDDKLSTLATVGDAQQAIYGFRGADLEVFQDMRAQMRAQGAREVELAENYRSQPDILRFVEDIFATPEFFGPSFLRVSSGRSAGASPDWLSNDEPRVEILLSAGHKADEGPKRSSIASLRRSDATALADEFERLHENGASYGDMAILMTSTKAPKSGPFVRELRKRGIPCMIVGGSDLYSMPEVAVVSMLLRVIANQDDDEALFELLGSSFFNVSDDDLLALSVINRRQLRVRSDEARSKPSLYDALRLYATEAENGTSEAILRAFEVIDSSVEAARAMPLSQVVRRAVELSGWKATLRAKGVEGGAAFADIERICDVIDEYEALNGRSVFGTSEYLREMVTLAQSGAGARAKLGTLASSHDDAVRIMTIHSSKGLEFPIVAVAEFEKKPKHSGVVLISLTEGGKRYLALDVIGQDAVAKWLRSDEAGAADLSRAADAAAFRARACHLKREREQEEGQRLLYVALTRARDKLILVAHDNAFASNGKLPDGLTKGCLRAVFGEELPTEHVVKRTGAGALVALSIKDVPYEEESAAEDDAAAGAEAQSLVVPHRYPAREEDPCIAANIPRHKEMLSYSSIAAREHSSQEARQIAVASMALRDRSRDAETVSPVGSAFHLVAQWLAVASQLDAASIEGRMLAAARRYALNEEERARLASTVASWVSSQRFERVRQASQRYAEYPFCVDVQGVPLEGYIDLLCLDGQGGALIIDYKTGTSGQGRDLRERYALQAHCYSYALLASGICERVEMVFVRPEAGMEEIAFSFAEDDVPMLESRILEP